MLVTTVSIRLALANICKRVRGTAPKVIPVAALGGQKHRLFGVLIPAEYKQEVYAYLAEHLTLSVSIDDDVVFLAPHEASALVQLGLVRDSTHAVA